MILMKTNYNNVKSENEEMKTLLVKNHIRFGESENTLGSTFVT